VTLRAGDPHHADTDAIVLLEQHGALVGAAAQPAFELTVGGVARADHLGEMLPRAERAVVDLAQTLLELLPLGIPVIEVVAACHVDGVGHCHAIQHGVPHHRRTGRVGPHLVHEAEHQRLLAGGRRPGAAVAAASRHGRIGRCRP